MQNPQVLSLTIYGGGVWVVTRGCTPRTKGVYGNHLPILNVLKVGILIRKFLVKF